MERFIQKHRGIWTKKSFLIGVILGALFYAAALFATYYANIFTVTHASNTVTDIILDNIPVVNVDFVFTEGATIFYVVTLLIIFYEPRRIPFVLKSIALFTFIRSLFMVLTHIAPPEIHSYLDTTDFFYKFSSGDDLFFSAHTGLPFMLAFVFWDEKYLRYLFFAFATIGGVSVLLGHLHYSIDVFSALFIAFGVFHMAKNLFRGDYALLKSAVNP